MTSACLTGVRESLSHDYEAVEAMLEKIEHGHLHLSVFGRVSTGKSSLLNALIGEERFSVSPLHGETRYSSMQAWSEVEAGGVFLIDTPGTRRGRGRGSRGAGEARLPGRSDLVIFVLDGDITETELDALKAVLAQGRPVIVVLNKSDLYTTSERRRAAGRDSPRRHEQAARSRPRHRGRPPSRAHRSSSRSIDGRQRSHDRARSRAGCGRAACFKLWDILEAEGKTLAALNASLFAADLSDQVGRRILAARREIGDKARAHLLHRQGHRRRVQPGARLRICSPPPSSTSAWSCTCRASTTCR